MTEKPKQPRKISFEQSLARLESIVTEMESGAVPLEKSIEKYAEGIELVKLCRKTLDSAEAKIQLLAKSDSGELTIAEDMEPTEQE